MLGGLARANKMTNAMARILPNICGLKGAGRRKLILSVAESRHQLIFQLDLCFKESKKLFHKTKDS